MATAYITRTPAGTGNQRTFTMSYWLKRAAQGVGDNFYSQSGGKCYLEFTTGDILNIGMNTSGTSVDAIKTNRVFRDPAAWYHIVLKMDTTQSTEADRMRLYINGVEEVAANWSTTNYPAEDADILINTTLQYYIGSQTASTNYFSGEMSHVQFVDGTALAPTEFGEFDSTSGIWKIKTTAYATPGTNGFYLKMEDRTNLDLDSSSNAFTFTTSGTLTATYDNPSNNFCLPNALSKGSTVALTNGNTTIAKDSGWLSCMGTFGMDASKWYWEQKVVTVGNANAGITKSLQDGTTHSSVDATRIMYGSDGNVYNAQGSTTATGTTFTTGDIISVALDCAGDTVKFYKNDVLIHTETETDISTNQWSPAWGMSSGTWDTNFGNGYFGTTAVTSANADDAGIGAFEYDVPAGYYCLCTKNIKAYGG